MGSTPATTTIMTKSSAIGTRTAVSISTIEANILASAQEETIPTTAVSSTTLSTAMSHVSKNNLNNSSLDLKKKNDATDHSQDAPNELYIGLGISGGILIALTLTTVVVVIFVKRRQAKLKATVGVEPHFKDIENGHNQANFWRTIILIT